MGGIGRLWATTKDGENGSNALRTRLRSSKNIEIPLMRSSEIRSAVDIDVKVKRTTCGEYYSRRLRLEKYTSLMDNDLFSI
jgi:hypothetical protein